MKGAILVALATALLVGLALTGARLPGAAAPAAAQDEPARKAVKEALEELDKKIDTAMTDFEEGRIGADTAFARVRDLAKFKHEQVIPKLPDVLGAPFATWHSTLNGLDAALESARGYVAGFSRALTADERRELIGRLQSAKSLKDRQLKPLVPKEQKGVLFGIEQLNKQIDQAIKDVEDGKPAGELTASIARLARTKHDGIVNELPKVLGASFSSWHDGLNRLDTALDAAADLAARTGSPAFSGKAISDLLGVAKTVKESALLALLGPCNERR